MVLRVLHCKHCYSKTRNVSLWSFVCYIASIAIARHEMCRYGPSCVTLQALLLQDTKCVAMVLRVLHCKHCYSKTRNVSLWSFVCYIASIAIARHEMCRYGPSCVTLQALLLQDTKCVAMVLRVLHCKHCYCKTRNVSLWSFVCYIASIAIARHEMCRYGPSCVTLQALLLQGTKCVAMVLRVLHCKHCYSKTRNVSLWSFVCYIASIAIARHEMCRYGPSCVTLQALLLQDTKCVAMVLRVLHCKHCYSKTRNVSLWSFVCYIASIAIAML